MYGFKMLSNINKDYSDLIICNCTIFNAKSCGISAMFDCLCHDGDAKMWFDC